MAIVFFPKAYATSSLRRDDAGRTIFFPDRDEKSGYVVPDAETEQRIFRQLKRIRLVQLAAWVLLPFIVIAAVVAADEAGFVIPKWLFLLGFGALMLAIQLIPEWARRNLARGLAPQAETASERSLLDRFPGWAIVLLITVAAGLALYLGRAWPLSAMAWLDDVTHLRPVLKAFAVVAAIVGGAVAVFWGGIGLIKRWFASSDDQAET